MSTLLFLPTAERGWRWARVDPAGALATGDGVPALDGPVVTVAPADAVTLHWATLPARSTAQAAAAARLLVAEASAEPIGELHVAVGEDGEGDAVDGGDERPIGVVTSQQMRGWLAALATAGVEAAAIVPAPMLLPRPAEGFWRADIAGEGVVRGPNSGFADEARLTELVTGGIAPEPLGRDDLAAALARAAAAPALDLRQGAFARRRRRSVDWNLVRRLAVLAGVILLATLAIDVVRAVRLELAADAADTRADALARSGLPRGETVTDPDRQLAERLSRVRGPGAGFSTTAAAVFAAVRGVPGAEITAMNFQPDGTLDVSLATQTEAGPTDVKRAIEAEGLDVRAGTFASAAGRVTGQFTVSAP